MRVFGCVENKTKDQSALKIAKIQESKMGAAGFWICMP
jgi:hypothetical protein